MMLRRSLPALALALAGLALALPARADKLEKDDKAWLDEIRPILLPQEEKMYSDLKKGERGEFRKIFWGRRDPDLETSNNEFQEEYLKLKAAADQKYAQGKKAGSLTDCGRVAILFGEADEVKAAGLKQTWVFVDKEGRKVEGGRVELHFEAGCMFAPSDAQAYGVTLVRFAEAKLAQPQIDYKLTPEGRLTPLADQLPKPTPAQALLKEGRTDFPVGMMTSMTLKGAGGGTYLAGIARAEKTGLAAGGKVQIVVQAEDAAGKKVRSPERDSHFELAEDGSVLVSYGVALRPGKYTVKVGVLDTKTGKGGVASEAVDVPDLTAAGMQVSTMMALYKINQGDKAPDALDPNFGFTLGNTQFIPRFGNVFSKADELTLLAAVYTPDVGPDGKPNYSASFKILLGAKTKAEAPLQKFDTETATPSVGPVPLGSFAPGKYTARLTVKDEVANKEFVRTVDFEVK